MIETFCTHPERDQLLVAYLYDEIAADARADFDRHLNGCVVCRSELEALGGVRSDLGAWTPPERAGTFTFHAPLPAAHKGRVLRAVRDLPVWAQLAAAMLVLGVSAGLANLNVSSGPDGWSVRTGWIRPAAPAPSAASVNDAATRADVAALERQLRSELQALNTTFHGAQNAAGAAGVKTGSGNEEEVVRRVRALVQESERRQQRELALRLAEVFRDVQMQRQADLVKIDRTLGVVQNSTGMAIRDQQQLLNNLAVRVSQRQ
jgi:hypothetical protein